MDMTQEQYETAVVVAVIAPIALTLALTVIYFLVTAISEWF
jgi:hypothetical protein